MTRNETIDAFLGAHGWSDATRTSIAGDASNRRYDRLVKASGEKVILMDAPKERGEDVAPFILIAQHLRDQDLSAPVIHAQDTDAGLLLIEDLSDDLFARVLERTPALEEPLYDAAIDVLSVLHTADLPRVAAYDAAALTTAAGLSFDWYLANADAADEGAKTRFTELFSPLAAQVGQGPKVLALRDYHAENLIWLPDRKGAARVGLLDFQDAMIGHPAYDLVSVLQDARRDVPPSIEEKMITRYLAQNDIDPETFRRDYAILGAQRNLRIIGVFARLCIRDGKEHYIDLIPRVWNHIQTNLAHPALAELKDHLGRTLPSPTTVILERLKRRCATQAQ